MTEVSASSDTAAPSWTLWLRRLTRRSTYFVLSHQVIAGDRSREKEERGLNLVRPLHPPTPPHLTPAPPRPAPPTAPASPRQEVSSPGGQRSERRPEAGHASLPPLPEGLLHQFALGGGVHAPKAAFARLVLGASHFQEVAVQGQVVSDRVLGGGGRGGRGPTESPCWCAGSKVKDWIQNQITLG